MNVFVLCTGRTASVTFTKACQHIDNYSASHESRVKLLGDERLNFPDNHIEVDNRLSWFLGKLGQQYGKEAFYVHLIRDREDTANSFMKRWDYPGSIIKAYTRSILLTSDKNGVEYCQDYVDTVNSNINYFLRDKPLQLTIQLEDLKTGFTEFWEQIGARGNMKAALGEFDQRNNASNNQVSLFKRLERLIKF
jgi:hypothetical protein